jgi:hypothetical protein
MVISNPKTDESQAPVHVEPQLRIILNRWKMTQTKKLGDKLENRAVNDCWMFPASESRTRRNEREHEDLLYAAGMPTMQPSTHLHRKDAYSDDVDGRFQRDVDGHSGHVDKVGAQRRWDDNHARYLRD